MKISTFIFYLSSLVYGATPDELSPFQAQPSINQEEIVPNVTAFDSVSIIQEPLQFEQIQLPPPRIKTSSKSPFLAVSLASLFPGLGHVYLGDMKTAGALAGSTGLGMGLGAYSKTREAIPITSLVTVNTAWYYSIYSAYRDVRIYNQDRGYIYKMPTDSFGELASAPFNFRILKKPEVWGGFLGFMALAAGTSYFAYPQEAQIHHNLSTGIELPFLALPIGIGEEALFRGFLQPYFSETLSPWGGITLSSLMFGAMHIPNALFLPAEHQWRYYSFSLPLITTMGAYFGWMTHKNRSLKESVSLHTWYDFSIFTAGLLASQAAIPGKRTFAIAIPF